MGEMMMRGNQYGISPIVQNEFLRTYPDRPELPILDTNMKLSTKCRQVRPRRLQAAITESPIRDESFKREDVMSEESN
jgi:hypothetical protein